jgi:hypothetical protein
MSQTPNTAIAVIGIDIGKNPFHVVGLDARGATIPVDPPRSFGRCGDDGVDLFGIERAMDHQGLGDRPYRRTMLGDQRLGLRRARRTQAALSIAPSPSMRRMVLLPLRIETGGACDSVLGAVGHSIDASERLALCGRSDPRPTTDISLRRNSRRYVPTRHPTCRSLKRKSRHGETAS